MTATPHRGAPHTGARSTFRRWFANVDLAPALAAVWLVHGLYNKLLGGSPRQLAIVQSVPGLAGTTGEQVLAAVGLAEVGLAIWMLSRLAPRSCAAVQTLMLLGMNGLELRFARHLLLWPAGLLPLNMVFLGLVWANALRRRRPGTGRPGPAWLRRHPIAVRATLRECVTLTYAVPAHVLRPLLPPGLELETVGDDGFVAVALVQTERLRPDGVPPALGGNFFLAGYRVFARFRAADGRVLRGLRILRSDTDRTLMALGGNLLTHYNYHRCRANVVAANDTIRFAVHTPDGTGDLDVIVQRKAAGLPPESPFASVREARRFAGPLPFTFDYEDATHSIVAIEGRRTNWRPSPVPVSVGRVAFFDRPPFAGAGARLAAAFYVRDIDYHWLRGVRHAL
jgi:type IV secretory pathway TrbD component